MHTLVRGYALVRAYNNSSVVHIHSINSSVLIVRVVVVVIVVLVPVVYNVETSVLPRCLGLFA